MFSLHSMTPKYQASIPGKLWNAPRDNSRCWTKQRDAIPNAVTPMLSMTHEASEEIMELLYKFYLNHLYPKLSFLAPLQADRQRESGTIRQNCNPTIPEIAPQSCLDVLIKIEIEGHLQVHRNQRWYLPCLANGPLCDKGWINYSDNESTIALVSCQQHGRMRESWCVALLQSWAS